MCNLSKLTYFKKHCNQSWTSYDVIPVVEKYLPDDRRKAITKAFEEIQTNCHCPPSSVRGILGLLSSLVGFYPEHQT